MKGTQFCSNEEPRPFQRGDNYEKAKFIDEIKKWLNHIWLPKVIKYVKRSKYSIHDFSAKHTPSATLKIFFSRITGPILTKPATMPAWVKGIQVCSNEKPFNSHKVNEFFLLLINIVIILCVFSGECCSPWAFCFKSSFPESKLG